MRFWLESLAFSKVGCLLFLLVLFKRFNQN